MQVSGSNAWFQPVSAYRIATFRVVVAVATIMCHVPDFDTFLRESARSSFHYPLFAWVPFLSLAATLPLIFARHVAAWLLLFGVYPRMSAAFLAGSSVYVFLLDANYFSHNAHLHVLLLALLGCSNDRVSLRRLIQPDDGKAVTLAWPERLAIYQLSFVFFITALDKAMNPTWGAAGDVIAELEVRGHWIDLAKTIALDQVVFQTIAGVLSVATILLEFFLALAMLVRPLQRFAIPSTFVFMMMLEFLLRPILFPWDIMAILLLLLPAGDRAYEIPYDPNSIGWLRGRQVLSRLDWLRRLNWVPSEPADKQIIDGLLLIEPTGKIERGFNAVRRLLVLFAGPLLALVVFIRFGGFGNKILGVLPASDASLLMLGALLLLWVPGVSRFVGQPLYGYFVRQCMRLIPPDRGNKPSRAA